MQCKLKRPPIGSRSREVEDLHHARSDLRTSVPAHGCPGCRHAAARDARTTCAARCAACALPTRSHGVGCQFLSCVDPDAQQRSQAATGALTSPAHANAPQSPRGAARPPAGASDLPRATRVWATCASLSCLCGRSGGAHGRSCMRRGRSERPSPDSRQRLARLSPDSRCAFPGRWRRLAAPRRSLPTMP